MTDGELLHRIAKVFALMLACRAADHRRELGSAQADEASTGILAAQPFGLRCLRRAFTTDSWPVLNSYR